MQHPQEYYIGLNISDTAIGWAVTDSEYHLLKANQKSLWGVRLFDRAETAKERRTFRYARRKLQRKNQRIQLLQKLFSKEIFRVDPSFFQRLRESKFICSDKFGIFCSDALFDDPNFTDCDYHSRYPTVYHLRKALLTENHPFDVRLVYLAIHHIVKHRGHFLSETSPIERVSSFETAIDELNSYLEAHEQPILLLKDAPAFEAMLRDTSLGKIAKKRRLLSAAGISKKESLPYTIIELLAGNKADLRLLFPNSNLKAIKIAIEDLQNEETSEYIFDLLGQESMLLQYIKALSDWAAVANLLNGEPYLSFSKVNCYEKHKADLALLKSEIKHALPEKYNEIFHQRNVKINNYPAYCGHKHTEVHCDYQQFKSYLQNILKTIASPTPNIQHILQELAQNTFLPIQTGLSNQIIPHSLHRQELVDILHRAERYLPFLCKQDADGLTVSDRILSIFDFKIPHFVGPLNPQSPYAWIVRNDDTVRPWNFEQSVNLNATIERFIALRTAPCAYLGCNVLPKDSLLYSEFLVLQTLNHLRIHGQPLSAEQKQQVLQTFFLKKKQVSRDKLIQHLIDCGFCQSENDVSGIRPDFQDSLRSQIVFAPFLPQIKGRDMAEDLIQHCVLFGRDKAAFRRYVQETYGHVLSENELRNICRQSFSGWGKLSKEFLTEIYHTDPSTGEAISIIEMMRRTTCTLSELLSGPYTFSDAVQEYRKQHYNRDLTLDDFFDENRAMPSAKRAIRQTILLVNEIIKIMRQQKPARIFMTAKNDQQNRQPVFIKNLLIERYQSQKNPNSSLLSQLSQENAASLYQEKLYLYYTQFGKCMYSGKPIDRAHLEDDTRYCIVPIYPSAYAIDDSLDNKVLVCREALRSCVLYPLPSEIQKQQSDFWVTLKESSLISSEKYNRLIRRSPFSQAELAEFISEQTTPSGHLPKLAAKALAWQYGNHSECRYVNMHMINHFRNQAGILLGCEDTLDFKRFRSVNDHHYAKDAYLSIVTGNVYSSSFTNGPSQRKQSGQECRFDNPYNYTLPHVWISGANGSIFTVWQTMRKNNVLFTRKAYEAHGGLFDQALLPKGKGQAPIKSSDPRMTINKFGGYNKLKGSYFCFVSHWQNNRQMCSIEAVYLMYAHLYQTNPIEYCEQVLGLRKPQIIIPCIKMDALFSFNGFRMHISGRSGGGKQITYKNANQLILNPQQYQYIDRLLQFLDRAADTQSTTEMAERLQITLQDNLALYETFEQKMFFFYGRMHTAPQKAIIHGKGVFSSLCLYEQCEVLSQMLNLFICRASSVNLSAIGGSKNGGRLLTVNTFSPKQKGSVNLIFQSITGVFEQQVDLVKLSNTANQS